MRRDSRGPCGGRLSALSYDGRISALSLYQAAECDYVRAIAGGYGYYQRQYEKVLEAQEVARDLAQHLM